MPQTRIEIEEIGPGRWVAEVEAGGVVARRKSVTAVSLDDIILAVIDTHAALTPAPTPRPVKEVLADQTAREEAAKAAADKAAAGARDAEDAAAAANDAEFAQAHAVADSERAVGEAEERVRQEEAAVPDASAQRTELIAQAEALGLTIDRRWGDARLREAVEAEHAKRAAAQAIPRD